MYGVIVIGGKKGCGVIAVWTDCVNLRIVLLLLLAIGESCIFVSALEKLRIYAFDG